MKRFFLTALSVLTGAAIAFAQTPPRPDEAHTIGERLPDTQLIDEHGGTFNLRSLEGKPLIISPIFTSCPHICGMITSSLRDGVTAIGEPGEKYNVLTVSFDAADTPESMREYRERLDLPDHWVLATATPEQLGPLLRTLDFNFSALPEGGFAHANLIAVTTPDQKISSYVYGVEFEQDDLRGALQTAVTGTSLVKKYRGWIAGFALVGCLITVIVVLTTSNRRERTQRETQVA
jgi:cytochrome oxidase Cu insertion factor (SCO1/SenC/PrrC family)